MAGARSDYDDVELLRLLQLSCDARPGRLNGVGGPHMAAACEEVDRTLGRGKYRACSARARAALVTRAGERDANGAECCDTLTYATDGAPRVVCRRQSAWPWLLVVPVLLLLALGVAALAVPSAFARRGRGGAKYVRTSTSELGAAESGPASSWQERPPPERPPSERADPPGAAGPQASG